MRVAAEAARPPLRIRVRRVILGIYISFLHKPADRLVSGPAQTRALFAFVCGSSYARGISCVVVNIMVYVSMLRTAEVAEMRLPLHCNTVNSCFFSKHFARLVGAGLALPS